MTAQTPLTHRQIEVLTLLAAGLSRHAAAAELHIGEATLRDHVDRARRQLGARTTIETVAIAIRAGLLGEGAS